jgi:hypothetical protein
MAKFFRRGKSKIRFCPLVANPAAPTRAELTAGTDLSDFVAEIGGFSLSNSPISTPDLGASFTKSIPGEDTTDESSLTLYDDDQASGAPYRTTLARGVEGYIVLMPYGDIPARRCEVWHVISTGINEEWSLGNDSARTSVTFSVNSVPQQNAVVPAAS